jgi:hypothetical protein
VISASSRRRAATRRCSFSAPDRPSPSAPAADPTPQELAAGRGDFFTTPTGATALAVAPPAVPVAPPDLRGAGSMVTPSKSASVSRDHLGVLQATKRTTDGGWPAAHRALFRTPFRDHQSSQDRDRLEDSEGERGRGEPPRDNNFSNLKGSSTPQHEALTHRAALVRWPWYFSLQGRGFTVQRNKTCPRGRPEGQRKENGSRSPFFPSLVWRACGRVGWGVGGE